MEKATIKALRRARSRGLTLVELVIVITILGVLTAAIAVGVVAVQKSANIKLAQTSCSSIRGQSLLWKQNHPGEDCPTLEQLKQDKLLDKGFSLKDPFGNPFRLNCDSDEITCSTAGPDHKEGTADDIIMPPPDSPPGS
jgi:general secretion pathway protein G